MSPCRRSGCASSPATPVARGAVLAAPAIRPKLGRDALLMRLLMAVIGLYLVVTLALPLYAILSKSVQAKDGSFVGLVNYARVFRHAGSVLLGLEQPDRRADHDRDHRAARLRLRLRADPQLHPGQGPVQDDRHGADPGAFAPARHRADLSVRQPGHGDVADVRPRRLRPDRDRDGRGLLHLPARADHRAHRAVGRRRQALRGGDGAAREQAQDLLDGDPARACATA